MLIKFFFCKCLRAVVPNLYIASPFCFLKKHFIVVLKLSSY